jgi:hypothetical protein
VDQPGYFHYIDVFKKMQAAGKAVLINEVKPQDVEPLLDALGSEKLFLVTGAASQEEADAVLRMAETHRVRELRVKRYCLHGRCGSRNIQKKGGRCHE